jgi:hypothetical protein
MPGSWHGILEPFRNLAKSLLVLISANDAYLMPVLDELSAFIPSVCPACPNSRSSASAALWSPRRTRSV